MKNRFLIGGLLVSSLTFLSCVGLAIPAAAASLPVSGSVTLPSVTTPGVSIPSEIITTPGVSVSVSSVTESTPPGDVPAQNVGGNCQAESQGPVSGNACLPGMVTPSANLFSSGSLTTPAATVSANSQTENTPAESVPSKTVGGNTKNIP